MPSSSDSQPLQAVHAVPAATAALAVYPSWPKGDLRRMLSVLVAIERGSNGSSSLMEIAAATGLDKRTITHQLRSAQEQAGVQLHKSGPRYRIMAWGWVFSREAVLRTFAMLQDRGNASPEAAAPSA